MIDTANIQTRIRSVMEDPSAQAVARVYAEAFLEAAKSVGVEEALEEFASFIEDVVEPNPQFEQMLLSDFLGRDEKVDLIDRAVAPYGSELFVNFLRVLVRHDRMNLLPLILEESRKRHERETGRRRVQVTSATPLSEAAVSRIGQRLHERFAFEPIIDSQTDPSLLGGLVIQVGDTVYDGSLRTRLRQLQDRIRQRSLHEIQSGRDRFSSPEGD